MTLSDFSMSLQLHIGIRQTDSIASVDAFAIVGVLVLHSLNHAVLYMYSM